MSCKYLLLTYNNTLKIPYGLFIGVDGGFDNHEAEYEEEYCIVVLPDYANIAYPSVDLPEKVNCHFHQLFSDWK